MSPSARPSEIYGPPGGVPERSLDDASEEASGPRKRWPLLVGLAVLALLAIGMLVAPDLDDGSAGDVDVAVEEQAIAALGLYEVQGSTSLRLHPGDSLFSQPGPDRIVRAAAEQEALLRERMDQARVRFLDPHPQVAAYVGSQAHDDYALRLADAHEDLTLVALLEALHATIYGGAGLVAVPDAERELQSRLAVGRVPEPLRAWAGALLAELDGTDRRAGAEHWRAEVDRWWVQRVAMLRPVEGAVLHDYVRALPPGTVRGLRGHPVAGRGLELLEGG